MAELRDNALLIRSIPYSDSSFIVHCFTQHHGRISLMARGARRAKSPFRAGLMPLHQLQIRWKEPRTGSMGTLLEVQRGKALLPESYMLSGQDLLAKASFLFPDGVGHGYKELEQACLILSERSEQPGLLAAIWFMLEASGLVGDFENCWHCSMQIGLADSLYWYKKHLLCSNCSSEQGILLSSDCRKGITTCMLQANLALQQTNLHIWQHIIQDMFPLKRKV